MRRRVDIRKDLIDPVNDELNEMKSGILVQMYTIREEESRRSHKGRQISDLSIAGLDDFADEESDEAGQVRIEPIWI